MSQASEWEKFYDDNTCTEWYPSEPVVRLLCSYKKRQNPDTVKVLDLGCGNGRHVWLAAKEGFLAYGIDISEIAIGLARNWLEKEGLKYDDLRSGDITSPLPYQDKTFDIVISYGVVDHLPFEKAKNIIVEIKRILKSGGILFLKLEADTSFTFYPEKQVSKNEIILDKKSERGLLQHFYDRDEVCELTKYFRPIQTFRDDYRHLEDLDTNYQSRWIFIGQNL